MTETPENRDSATRWGMVVDLNRCVGCQTCTIACKHANDTPPGVQWRRVLDVERGTFPDVERLFLVTGCQHCAEPPCVPVCPTGATAQRADGLVTMDYDTCIGCGYCAVACPYQARTIVHDKSWYYGEPTVQERHVHHDDRYGVANKCTFCVERIDDALDEGLTPGVDLTYTPACVASCIAGALHFGDFANSDSNVSHLTRDNVSFQMHAELGTDPQIKYLFTMIASATRLLKTIVSNTNTIVIHRNIVLAGVISQPVVAEFTYPAIIGQIIPYHQFGVPLGTVERDTRNDEIAGWRSGFVSLNINRC